MTFVFLRVFCYPLLLTSGDSTETPGLSAEGIAGRVLLILTEVISMLFWVVVFAPAAYILIG